MFEIPVLVCFVVYIIISFFHDRSVRKRFEKLKRSHEFLKDYVMSKEEINTETIDGVYATLRNLMERIRRMERFLEDDMEQDAIMNGKGENE